GARGGRVVQRSHYDYIVAADGDLEPDAAVLALRLLLERRVRARVHERRVRIERVHHAVDGAVQQAGLVDLLDVVILDQRQNVAEDVELLVRAGRIARGLGDADREKAAQRGAGAEQQESL